MATNKPRRMPVSASQSTPRDNEMLDILLQMNSQLAEVRAEVRGVNERLDRLNGSVAAHERRIGTIEGFHHVEAGTRGAHQKWMKVLWPLIYTAGGCIVTLILTYGREVLAAVRH